MTDRTKKASLGFMTSILQYLIIGLLQALLTPLILKIAGQQVLGAYSIVMQIIGYSLLLDLGLSNALLRSLSQTFNFTDRGNMFINYINVGRFFILITNTISAIFILLIAINLNSILSDNLNFVNEAKISLYILAVWTLIRSPLLIYNHALLASQNMTSLNILGIITSLVRLILSVLFVVLKLGLLGLILANILAEVISVSSQYFLFVRKYRSLTLIWQRPDTKILKELLPFGLKYWGINLSIIFSVGSDSILLGYLYGSAIAGVYYTTKIPTFLAIQLIYKLVDNSGPAINELYYTGKFESLKNAYLKILKYSFLLAIASSIGVIYYNEYFISIWVGEKQYAGYIMSFGLASYLTTQVINHVNASIVLASGEISKWTYMSIFLSVISLFFSFVLGKYFGFQWVMITIAVLDYPFFYYLGKKSLSILKVNFFELFNKILIPVLKISSLLFFLASFMNFIVTKSTFILLFFKIISFGLFFILLVYLIALDSSEKNKIKLLLSKFSFNK
jgi:O-antigen/teichoic acid export membrane protein